MEPFHDITQARDRFRREVDSGRIRDLEGALDFLAPLVAQALVTRAVRHLVRQSGGPGRTLPCPECGLPLCPQEVEDHLARLCWGGEA